MTKAGDEMPKTPNITTARSIQSAAPEGGERAEPDAADER